VWQHVNYTQWSWDPGGSMFAVCRSQHWWPNLERLRCPEELEWSFVLSARAFWIWLVAWDVDNLEFSAYGGQATFQGWTIAIRVTFSNHIARTTTSPWSTRLRSATTTPSTKHTTATQSAST
jgi:hypothetical protein